MGERPGWREHVFMDSWHESNYDFDFFMVWFFIAMVNHEKNHLGNICLHLKQTQDGSPTYTNLVFVYMGVSKNGGYPKLDGL